MQLISVSWLLDLAPPYAPAYSSCSGVTWLTPTCSSVQNYLIVCNRTRLTPSKRYIRLPFQWSNSNNQWHVASFSRIFTQSQKANVVKILIRSYLKRSKPIFSSWKCGNHFTTCVIKYNMLIGRSFTPNSLTFMHHIVLKSAKIATPSEAQWTHCQP